MTSISFEAKLFLVAQRAIRENIPLAMMKRLRSDEWLVLKQEEINLRPDLVVFPNGNHKPLTIIGRRALRAVGL